MEPLLKTYYKRYLVEVRRLKKSTVNHYCDALNNITRHLQAMNLIDGSIYDIMDLQRLKDLREILFADPVFAAQNKKGNQMYSAGFNNYVRFAEGGGLTGIPADIDKMDIPMPAIAEEPQSYEVRYWARSNILREQTLAFAGYHCEMDGSHPTFIAERTHKPYMESHHAIPIHFQHRFAHSLDVYANLICLCPVCHRKIHYGLRDERREMMYEIYEKRHERMVHSGLVMGKEEFADFILTDARE